MLSKTKNFHKKTSSELAKHGSKLYSSVIKILLNLLSTYRIVIYFKHYPIRIAWSTSEYEQKAES